MSSRTVVILVLALVFFLLSLLLLTQKRSEPYADEKAAQLDAYKGAVKSWINANTTRGGLGSKCPIADAKSEGQILDDRFYGKFTEDEYKFPCQPSTDYRYCDVSGAYGSSALKPSIVGSTYISMDSVQRETRPDDNNNTYPVQFLYPRYLCDYPPNSLAQPCIENKTLLTAYTDDEKYKISQQCQRGQLM